MSIMEEGGKFLKIKLLVFFRTEFIDPKTNDRVFEKNIFKQRTANIKVPL